MPAKSGGTLHAHLGGIIVAQKGRPIQITFTNTYRPTHHPGGHHHPRGEPGHKTAPRSTCTAASSPGSATAAPIDWFDPHRQSRPELPEQPGASWIPAARTGQAEYYYGNDQSARLMWYHDHAWGITRTNAYAGHRHRVPASCGTAVEAEPDQYTRACQAYIEAGGREIPIVIQDKIFVAPNILTIDPTWNVVTDPGAGQSVVRPRLRAKPLEAE